MNLKDYEKGAKGEIRGTPEAYISLPAVGLVKLAKRYGLSYEGKHTLIQSLYFKASLDMV
ncbi:hypothetical protein [Photobacterium arenosum]|uniref:hypothetical protein n=1 Tax=Photobacterium arenosum TaxID=2774143 RepID=UPI0028896C83|nr:hypothetical protein [Photobacterium arenosum]